MSGDPQPIDDELQKAMGADYLHSVTLQAFFAGLYTSTLAFFLFVNYMRRENGRRWLTAMIVIQYCLIMMKVVYACQELVQHFILDTVEETLERYFYPSTLDMFLPHICYFSAIIIPDILIIWRCWHVWNRNMYIAFPLILLVVVEAGLYIFLIYANVTLAPAGPDEMLDLLKAGSTATMVAYVLTSSVTLVASVLIILRIYLVGRMQSVRRHKLVIELLIESALLYTIPLLVFTVLNQVFLSSVATGISSAIVTGMMGLAPLLLVTRIQLGFARPDSTWAEPLSLMWRSKTDHKTIDHVRSLNDVAPADVVIERTASSEHAGGRNEWNRSYDAAVVSRKTGLERMAAQHDLEDINTSIIEVMT